MISLDPIRPYLWLAKWIGAALILSTAFIGGCNHGQSEQLQDDEARIAKAERERDDQAAHVATLSGRLRTIDAETAEVARQAADQKRAADEAAKRAVLKAQALQAELAGIEADIAKAKRDPDCKRMMEARTCALLH